MNYPGEGVQGVPVVLGARPGWHRGRLNSDHRQQQVFVEANGYLYPANGLGQGVQRSASSSGHGRRSPTQIFINNTQRDEHSPIRSSRRRSAQYVYEEDDWDEPAHSPSWQEPRHRSRVRHHRGRQESRSPSPMPPPVPVPVHNPETEEKLRRLHAYEEKEKEAERKRKFEEEQVLKKMAEEKAKKKEEDMKKAAIQEYNTKQLEKAAKEKKEKEDAEKEFRERVKATFGKAGYSDQSIERILENKGNDGHAGQGQKKIMDLSRPTHIKVHRKHLSPDTLDAYQLPWEFDSQDGDYLIIRRWIPEHEQDVLFEHTRRMREGRLLTNTTVELKKERDNLLLVRKRSPNRKRSVSRSWMFT